MKKSFTLIELLVTMFLISLLIASAMMSFKLFLKRSDIIKEEIPKNAMVFNWIERSISGMYPYVLKNFKYFFSCSKNKMEYITTTPLIFNNMSVAKIIYENGNINYYESPLFYKTQDYLNPRILDDNYSKISLFKNVKNFNIKCSTLFGIYIFKIDNQTYIFNVFSDWKKLNSTLKEKMSIQ